MNLYQKLSTIQKNLIAPKGQRNDFGKFNYRSCEDIIKALKPLLDENKCLVYLNNDMEQIGGRVYVKATVTLIDLESDQTITVTAHAREEEEKKGMDGSQITGASTSYARKYALAGLFMIDNESDSDVTSTNSDDKPKAQKNSDKDAANTKLITPEQKASILAELNRTHVDKEQVLDRYKVKELDDIPSVCFDKLIKMLKAVPDWEDKA